MRTPPRFLCLYGVHLFSVLPSTIAKLGGCRNTSPQTGIPIAWSNIIEYQASTTTRLSMRATKPPSFHQGIVRTLFTARPCAQLSTTYKLPSGRISGTAVFALGYSSSSILSSASSRASLMPFRTAAFMMKYCKNKGIAIAMMLAIIAKPIIVPKLFICYSPFLVVCIRPLVRVANPRIH